MDLSDCARSNPQLPMPACSNNQIEAIVDIPPITVSFNCCFHDKTVYLYSLGFLQAHSFITSLVDMYFKEKIDFFLSL